MACDAVSGECVGYLDRRKAREFRSTVATIEGHPFEATLTGGTTGKPYIGIYFEAGELLARRTIVQWERRQQRKREASDSQTKDGNETEHGPPSPLSQQSGCLTRASLLGLALLAVWLAFSG
jgi:hypothetical protein